MHKVLLLNDFSENAAVAFRYAERIAEAHGAVLSQVACHADAVLPLHRAPEAPATFLADLEGFSAGLGPKVELEYLNAWVGNAEAACQLADEIRAGLVVAPESGPYSLELARSLARRSTLPLLLVPSKAVFREPRKIVFGVSFHFNDLLALNMLRRWVQLLDAKLDIIHVPESENQVAAAAEKMGALAELLSGGLPFAFQLLKVAEPEKAILEYVNKENAGMLALTTHRRSAWTAFFESSTSDYLLRQCAAPLLLIKELEDSV